MVRLLVVALCGVALAACAVRQPKTSAPASAPEAAPAEATSGGAPHVLPDSQRDQLLKLEAELDAHRTTLQLAEPMPADFMNTPVQPLGALVATDDPKCRPGKSETCTNSCTLSNNICKNADSICRLAVEINDDWARGKCAKANKTCEASRTKCCGCQ